MINYKNKKMSFDEYVIYRCYEENALTKNKAFKLLESKGIYPKKTIKKAELMEIIKPVISAKELYFACRENLGLSAYYFQENFKIAYKDVKWLESNGYLKVVGYKMFHEFGKSQYIALYDSKHIEEYSEERLKQVILNRVRGIPISLERLHQLFEYLDERELDHHFDLRYTINWMKENQILGDNPDKLLEWLQEKGGYDDLEVMLNVAPYY